MEFFSKGLNEEAPDCSSHVQDIQRCPFLRNINKPTNFSLSSGNFPLHGGGKDGVVPLSERSRVHNDKPEPESAPLFNPLPAKAATISLSASGPGLPFNFISFSEKLKTQKKKSESTKRKEPFLKGDSSKHEALENEWLETGTCPIAKSYSAVSHVRGGKGPIFEDGPNLDTAFKLFHGKDGVVPLSERSRFHNDKPEPESAPLFNPLAAKAATTISLSAYGPGVLFNFNSFSESSKRKEPSLKARRNEWLETGNCPIAKSYRAVSHVLPRMATALQSPDGMKFMLGMAANIALGARMEHTQKFSLSLFFTMHAAVHFIDIHRKSVLMPKTAMGLTIAASVLGQVIGSRAERLRLKFKAKAEQEKMAAQTALATIISVIIQARSMSLSGVIVVRKVGPAS